MPVKKKKPAKKRSQKGSPLEALFEQQLRYNGIKNFSRELPFAAPARRWRLDFAWPDVRVGVEIQGGTWKGGRHTRGKGFESDTEKRNWAKFSDWTVLEFTSKMVKSGEALKLTLVMLERKGIEPWQ